MSITVATSTAARHRAIGEIETRMAKAALPDVPKGENREFLAAIGACLDAARREVGWTVDRLAKELQRDSKQVARWMRGEERTQVDVVFSVRELQQPFVVALAKCAACEVETTVRIRVRREVA